MKRILGALIMIFFVAFLVNAQEITTSGKVVSASDGLPVPGASVLVKGTTTGTITGFDGEFSIKTERGALLVVSFIGFQPVEVAVTGQFLNISLKEEVRDIDEVIVVGYGVQKKSLVTGAISSIDSKEINMGANTRLEQSIQGKTAGVYITNSSGQPGEAVSIKIRGTSTFNGGAQPLYVVDGIPQGNIDYLNPGDIESIEILKDAASAAIYGARAANGVVMVTSKQGKSGDLKISYDGYYAVQNAWKKMGLLNAREYGIIINEAAMNSGQSLPFSNSELAKLGEGTDWQDEIFYDNAPIQNHQISASGGTDKALMNASFSYFNQDGIVAKGKSNFERYTFNFNGTFKGYNDRLVVRPSVVYTHINKMGVDPNSEWNSPLSKAINIDPVTPVRNADGSWGVSPYVSQEIFNPVGQLEYLFSKYRLDKIVGNLSAEYELVSGLKLRSSVGLDYAYGISDGYTPIYQLTPTIGSPFSSVNKSIERWYNLNWENVLSYSATIAEDHGVNALLGTTTIKNLGENLGGYKTDLIFSGFSNAYIDNATNEESMRAWGGGWESRLVSFFGRLNYDYKSRYMLTAILRRDGSSNFGSNNRFGTFPSVSVGWNISEESFMQDVPAVEFMKLRAGWGTNGSDNLPAFAYTSIINDIRRYTFGDSQTILVGSSPERVSNPDLKWETTEQLNIGLDYRALNGALSVTLDWYRKTTRDLLIYTPIPSFVGNASPWANAGKVQNQGFEFLVGYNTKLGDVNLRASVNGTFNNNEVLEVGNESGYLSGASVATSMNQVTRVQEGFPIGYFYGYKTNGIFQNQAEIDAYVKDGKKIQPDAKPGDFRWVDANNDGKINEDDRGQIGNPNPKFHYGINVGADWKGFDVSLFFTGVQGNDIFNGTRRYDLPMSNWGVAALDRWHGEGTSNSHPRVTLGDDNQNYSRPSDFYVEDGSFFRLKNLTVGYTLPKNLMERVKIDRVRLYVTAQNLWTITNYTGFDPEMGSASDAFNQGIDRGIYPQARTFMVGLNVNF